MKCKGKVFIGFGFCEGGAIYVEERGFLQIGEDEVSLFWPLGRPWKRERKRGINGGSEWKCVEVGILERIGILENGKACGLWRKEEN